MVIYMGCSLSGWACCSTGYSSFRKYPNASVWGPPLAAMLFSASTWFSPCAAGKYILHCGLFHGLQVSLCSVAWSASFPLTSVCSDISHLCFSLSSACLLCLLGVYAFFFLNTFSMRQHHLDWWVQLFPKWVHCSWLELAISITRQTLASYHRGLLLPILWHHMPVYQSWLLDIFSILFNICV